MKQNHTELKFKINNSKWDDHDDPTQTLYMPPFPNHFKEHDLLKVIVHSSFSTAIMLI